MIFFLKTDRNIELEEVLSKENVGTVDPGFDRGKQGYFVTTDTYNDAVSLSSMLEKNGIENIEIRVDGVKGMRYIEHPNSQTCSIC